MYINLHIILEASAGYTLVWEWDQLHTELCGHTVFTIPTDSLLWGSTKNSPREDRLPVPRLGKIVHIEFWRAAQIDMRTCHSLRAAHFADSGGYCRRRN